MARWPEVTERTGEPPPVERVPPEEDLVLARGPELVTWGTVDGIPWKIEAIVTAPGPEARWWEHGPVGPKLAFWLGAQAAFGGMSVFGTRLNEGTHLSASIDFFGSHPGIVSWVGVVSDAVDRLEVRLDDGDVRESPLHDGPTGFPRLFWFFPPRGAEGRIVALASDGSALQTEHLVDVPHHPASNSGTSVNGFGVRTDRPPPGWPDDPTEYGPGEGPRHEEDFHLHEVAFALYVVPPDRWQGFAGLSGSGGSERRIDHVEFGYFDEPGGSERGFEVMSASPGRQRPHGWPDPALEDVGVWTEGRYPEDEVYNFAGRFLGAKELDVFQDEHGLHDFGPSRIESITEAVVGSERVELARREYRQLPAFRSIHLDLPANRVALFGWNLSFDELTHYAELLEPLDLDSPLLEAMKAAQAGSDRRFDELHGHRHD